MRIIVQREREREISMTKDSLKAILVIVMSALNQIKLIQTFQRFRSQIKIVIDDDSGFIE